MSGKLEMGEKGQFFIIGALIFIIYFWGVASYSSVGETVTKKGESMEHYVLSNYYDQIKDEEKKLFEHSYYNQSLMDQIKNFTLWTRGKFKGRNADLRTVFLLTNYSQITAGQEETLQARLLSLEDRKISSIEMTFNQTTRTRSDLSDGSTFSTTFSFQVSSDQDKTLNLSYKEAGETWSYDFSVPLRVDKKKKIGFWILTLERGNFRMVNSFSSKT